MGFYASALPPASMVAFTDCMRAAVSRVLTDVSIVDSMEPPQILVLLSYIHRGVVRLACTVDMPEWGWNHCYVGFVPSVWDVKAGVVFYDQKMSQKTSGEVPFSVHHGGFICSTCDQTA